MFHVKHRSEATIYALASGAGRAGVAVVRISGGASCDLIRSLTGTDVPKPRQAVLRRLIDPRTADIIDEGLLIWFPGPMSFLHR